MRTFRKGEIFWIETGKTYSIAKKVRPGVIVSKDELNDRLPTVEIVYLTTHPKGESECHCVVGGAEKPSVALCENVLTVHNSQVGDYIGSCTQDEMDEIDKCIMRGLGLETNIYNAMATDERITELEKEKALLEKEVLEARSKNELLREMYNDLLLSGR